MEAQAFDCTLCGTQFRKAKHLRYHMDTVHCPARRYQCDQCENAYKRQSHLRRHVQSAHSAVSSWVCPIESCGKQFKGAEQFKKHLKRHEKSHSCDLCGKSFSKKRQLESHKAKIHGPFPCVHCELVFATRKEFTLHIRESHLLPTEESGAITCQYCTDLTFESKEELRMHIAKQHTTFPCGICGSSFSRERDLRSHIMSKHADDPSSEADRTCGECGLVFSSISNLNTHIRVSHEKSQKFTCDICQKHFGHKHVLNRHMVNVHKQIRTLDDSLSTSVSICTPERHVEIKPAVEPDHPSTPVRVLSILV
jgi:KRAB domain-containing zinc finger protein